MAGVLQINLLYTTGYDTLSITIRRSNGEKTTRAIEIPAGKRGSDWLKRFATGKPYELGLHKRGRSYHVSLSGDGKRQQYETDKLSSLRLPGKELAIVVSADGGQIQALIDSIEITRVSE